MLEADLVAIVKPDGDVRLGKCGDRAHQTVNGMLAGIGALP